MANVKVRRDTAAAWAAGNPVLTDGEPGWDKTAKKLKIGDGVTPWVDLPAASGETGPQGPAGPQGIAGPQWSEIVVEKTATNVSGDLSLYIPAVVLPNRVYFVGGLQAAVLLGAALGTLHLNVDTIGLDSDVAYPVGKVQYFSVMVDNDTAEDLTITLVPSGISVEILGANPIIAASSIGMLNFMVVRRATQTHIFVTTVGA